MNFEIIDRNSLKEYIRIWKWLDWDKVIYSGDVLNPDCIAFGMRDKGKPEAVIIAELNEYAEIKILNYNSTHALKILMRIFSGYLHSLRIGRLLYELKIAEEDELLFNEMMSDYGWNKPQVKHKIYELKKNNFSFFQRTEENKLKGKIVSFFETTLKQRYELALILPEDSVYYQVEVPENEFSIAYVEDDGIKGYVLSEYKEGSLYLTMDRMSAQPQAIVGMMKEVVCRLTKKHVNKVFVVVKTKYGEQLLKKAFLNQIIRAEIIIGSFSEV